MPFAAKNALKNAFYGAFISGALVWGGSPVFAQASTIFSTGLNGNANLWNSNFGAGYSSSSPTIVCGFGMGVGYLNALTTSTFTASLRTGADNPNDAYIQTYTTGSVAAVFQPSSSVHLAFTQFNFPECVAVDPGEQQWFVVSLNPSGVTLANKMVVLGVTSTDPQRQWVGAPMSRTNPDQRASLEIYGQTGSLNLLFPEANSTPQPFTSWLISRNFPASTTGALPYRVYVDYSRISSSSWEFFDDLESSIVDEPWTTNIPGQDGFPLLDPTETSRQYFVRLRAVNASGTVFASTTPITFTVALPVYATSTCSSGNLFSDSLCWAFIPPPNFLAGFSTAWDIFKDRPPLGYVTRIFDSMGGITTSSPAYQISELSDVPFFQDFDISVSGVLAFAGLVWAVVRFKKITV